MQVKDFTPLFPQLRSFSFFEINQAKDSFLKEKIPIFVALDQGLNVSMKANIQSAVIESQI